ncbi:hypothetical protein BH683_002350 [Williamsia sp. 1138]|uniref:hypothetical protein n=1 Tax=Williamsia sp. 1138 TaxID=1903117 RepID=UPI000A0F4996|nr:hypothetical protein [Williamsia sp. 1138]OZG30804.1 hypothetical protein BH683_002350 [Williamsia sp. 1138]
MAVTTSFPVLRPGVAVLVRPGGRIQVGCDPDTAIIVEPSERVNSARLARLLRSMTSGRPPTEVEVAATEAGLSGPELAELLDNLVVAGVAHRECAGSSTRLRVRVHGSGPLAIAISGALDGAGVDLARSVRRPSLIDTEDHDPMVHQDRVSAWATDLVMLTDYLTHDPWLVSSLMRHRIPHLMVRLRDGVGVIGPLVLPGLTSCLHCADHHRTDQDRDWPTVSAQLLGTCGWAGSATIAGTVAVATAQIEQIAALSRSGQVDPPPPSTLNTTIEFRANPSSMVVRHWPPHPLCGCRSAW